MESGQEYQRALLGLQPEEMAQQLIEQSDAVLRKRVPDGQTLGWFKAQLSALATSERIRKILEALRPTARVTNTSPKHKVPEPASVRVHEKDGGSFEPTPPDHVIERAVLKVLVKYVSDTRSPVYNNRPINAYLKHKAENGGRSERPEIPLRKKEQEALFAQGKIMELVATGISERDARKKYIKALDDRITASTELGHTFKHYSHNALVWCRERLAAADTILTDLEPFIEAFEGNKATQAQAELLAAFVRVIKAYRHTGAIKSFTYERTPLMPHEHMLQKVIPRMNQQSDVLARAERAKTKRDRAFQRTPKA